MLLTALLVLAVVASSALVFTNEVELLKLAVLVALWAAVVAAFVSFIYRRQSDIDQAKSRDLKLVYDLQLDREISARREYELSVESHLRRELASELRTETSDEVAALRAELAALRANLEIIFDTDLQSRPAIETERTAVHGPGRVISSRIDTEAPEDVDPTFDTTFDPNTEESPIIDVPAEPHPPDDEWAAQDPGGAHRRPSEREPVDNGWRAPHPEVNQPWQPPPPSPPPPPPQRQEPERPARHAPAGLEWRPAPAEGQYIPAGRPGSNWTTPEGDPRASVPAAPSPTETPPSPPAMTPPSTTEPSTGRHYPAETAAHESARRARHSSDTAHERPAPPPVLATPTPPPSIPTAPPPEPSEPGSARHRGGDDAEETAGQHAGGQPLSELMARLQVGSTGGGRRRRRDE